MLIDGKKMACEACIRGHRVSGCQHRDRKLVEIAKKGRPVTQCHHCRSLRKSRSTHVKCECSALAAAKRARAQLKSEGEHKAGEKRAAGSQHADVAPSAAATTEVGSDSKSGSASPCSCCHGGRCTCALKKEPPPKRRSFDAMIEMPKVPPAPSAATDPIVRVPRPKTRLQSTHSDTALMTFINGHHKPTHRYHSSIHGSSPYNIPTVGHTGHTFCGHEGSHKVQHTNHDGTSSVPPASSPRHRRHKSEHDSPAPMTYLAIPMASNPSQSSMITPLELTPRPSAPARPTINRTSSGRIQAGLSVITDNSYSPYSTFNNFAPEPLLLSSGREDQYVMSANLDPSATSGWPSFTPQYENFDMFEAANPLFNSTAFCDEVRGYSMYNSIPIARTNASSDEFDPDYRNTSPPSLVSQALSNADSEDYTAFSAHSSYIDLSRLADVSEERTMSSVPEEPEQSIPTTGQHRNPFMQGYIPPVTATPATTPTGESMFNPFAVMYDNRAALKGINDSSAELMSLGAMTGLGTMGLGALGTLGGMGGLEMGLQGMGMGGLDGVRGGAEGTVRQEEEFLYMGWG